MIESIEVVKDDDEDEVEEETINKGDSNDLPPDPLDPDKSNDKESHEPIKEDEIIVTTGREGSEGEEIFTNIEELFFQPLQGITFDNKRHLARILESFNFNLSPTFNKGIEVEEDEDEEVEEEMGYNEKLWSSTHTQRVEDVIEGDSTIESQENTFKYPPRFVGESNSTNTLTPSRENVADFIKGGEGSESGLNTLKDFPRGYSIE